MSEIRTEQETRKCTGCKVEQLVNEDNFKKNRKGIFNKTCLTCAERRKGYRCEHNRQCKSRCKDCLGHSVNKDKCSRCKKHYIPDETKLQTCEECRYYSDCPHGIRIKKNCKDCVAITRRNYRNTEIGKLTHIVRLQVYKALKRDKELSSQKYLGCDIKTFKEHIEKQFNESMSWENYGEWHIDHIVPIKYKENGEVPSIEEVIKRLHYTNTQPMKASENISKGNRYVGDFKL